jgi:hypothetical protein
VVLVEHEIAERARLEGDDHGAFGCRLRINFSRGVQDSGAYARWRAQQRYDVGRESVSFLRARLLELRQALGDLDPALGAEEFDVQVVVGSDAPQLHRRPRRLLALSVFISDIRNSRRDRTF